MKRKKVIFKKPNETTLTFDELRTMVLDGLHPVLYEPKTKTVAQVFYIGPEEKFMFNTHHNASYVRISQDHLEELIRSNTSLGFRYNSPVDLYLSGTKRKLEKEETIMWDQIPEDSILESNGKKYIYSGCSRDSIGAVNKQKETVCFSETDKDDLFLLEC